MIELDDCGRELHLQANQPWTDSMDVTVQMIIKAPRGTMVLFEDKPRRHYEVTKVLAIRAFMKEHKND